LGSVQDVLGSREDRAGRADVDAVGPPQIRLVGISHGDVMLFGSVVIQLARIEPAVIAALALKVDVLAIVVAVRRDAVLQSGLSIRQRRDLSERLENDRVGRRRKSGRACERQEVARACDVALVVTPTEISLDGFGSQHLPYGFSVSLG